MLTLLSFTGYGSELYQSYRLEDIKNIFDLEQNESSTVPNQISYPNKINSVYFEGKVFESKRNNLFGIGIKSAAETLKYIWDDDRVFSSITGGFVQSKAPWKLGDVIGFRVFQINRQHHCVSITKNGSVQGDLLDLQGNLPISVALVTAADSKKDLSDEEGGFVMNFGDHPFQHIGNYISIS